MAPIYQIVILFCFYFIPQNIFAFLPCITLQGAEGRCMKLGTCVITPQLPIQSPAKQVTLKELLALRRTGARCRLGQICCAITLAPTLVLAPRVAADELTNPNTETAQDPVNTNFTTIPQVFTPPPVPVGLTDKRLGRLPLATCGLSVVNFIVDGIRAESGQFPWMALLCAGIGNIQGVCMCSGTLIARKYILTAASCISFLPPGSPRPSMAVLGDIDSNSATATTARRFGIQRFIPHPDFHPEKSREHDIAVLWLNKEIDFTQGIIRPVCLPVGRIQFKNLDSSTDVTVAGWGSTDRGNSSVPNQVSPMSQFLQYTTLRTTTNARCIALYGDKAVITPSMVCAGQAYEGPCRGDLGSPLTMLDYVNVSDTLRVVQVGVNSWNPIPCGTPANPGVYTRCGYYLDWILDQIP